ncbi:adenylate/guanylate cyclase family protein [Pseudonocardia sediminis]|uniref:Adenylate/guanylate cyclase family protein n=1 Tax=Pseudonocardia sediminis TaxID=1397368 RepID=A0A4Q7UUZ6_PSEST|nr:adenylate/guanylate cyclase domain-containing protein [Pseudonocardia sediminis]RZT83859.1 adenylate/guanylate cyclase family protein [Pseudonocardia sediminis]
MGLKEDITNGINDVLSAEWNTQNATVVPKTEDVTLTNGAKLLDATYLYADMADSTGLAQGYKNWAVAKVMRTYLNAATRILKAEDGHIRSFDGDRVMAIFIGDAKNSSAAAAGLKLNWVLDEVINPALKAKWTDFNWVMTHGVGIDSGEAMIVRGGVRGNNDLVSIGRAPNIAAKLSEVRGGKRMNITSTVYNNLNKGAKISTNGENMWTSMGTTTYGSNQVTYYGSSWRRPL